MNISVLIGDAVKRERIKAGFTQLELAKKSKLSQRSIEQIESGKSDPPIYTIHKIALALKMDIEKLLEDF